MATVKEKLIDAALEEVRGGVSQRLAAKRYKVAQSTLSERLHGSQSATTAKTHLQRLSPEQEIFLSDWIRGQEVAGRAPNRRQVARFAQAILKSGGDEEPLGIRWVDRFLRRNPGISMRKKNPLEAARIRGSTKGNFERFYGNVEHQINTKNILPANIANMDEHGLQELDSGGGKVLGDALARRTYVSASDATNWVTIIECGTAEGRRLTPVVVWTGASLQGQWFPDRPPDWGFEKSSTGWSNTEIALKWLNNIYLPQTKPKNPSEWRLLILDEHSSHIDDVFMTTAIENKVWIEYLPSHTSHKTQPLDRSVFRAVKSYFRQKAQLLAPYNASAPVYKQWFLDCYVEASAEGMSLRNMISGFRKTGIWPLNPAMVLEDPEAVFEEDPRPKTPPQRSQPTQRHSQTALVTPQKAQDLRESLNEAQQQLAATDRTFRTLFSKTGKALDLKNAQIASLEAKVADLQTVVEAQKPYTKKTVKEPPPGKFARLADIMAAKEASKNPPKRRRTAKPVCHVEEVEEVRDTIIHGLDQMRRIEEME
jgi:4-hydroxybenzoate polyprenyltransferase